MQNKLRVFFGALTLGVSALGVRTIGGMIIAMSGILGMISLRVSLFYGFSFYGSSDLTMSSR